MSEIALGALGEFPPGSMRAVSAGGRPVLVVRKADGEAVVLEDRCPHALVPLSLGELRGGRLRCLAHGAEFDLDTGAPACGPARTPAVIFPSRVERGILFATLTDETPDSP